MSFGLEVFAETGETVFEAGKSYVKIVGEWTLPSRDSSNSNIIRSTFVIPSMVPADESPVIICSKLFPPEYFTVTDRTVTVHHIFRLRYVGSTRYWTTRQAKLYLGYYG